MVVYIYSSLLQLAVESLDLSQPEKKILLLQAEQILKMTTIFRQILLVSKTFSRFPSLEVQNCFFFKVKLLVLSNWVLPEQN